MSENDTIRLRYTPLGKSQPREIGACPIDPPSPKSNCFYGLDEQGRRCCFIKIPHDNMQRFQCECQARDQSSPFVVDCLGLGQLTIGQKEYPAIIYQYAPTTLRKYMTQKQQALKSVPPGQVIPPEYYISPAQYGEILCKLLRALIDVRYRQGAAAITHADVKPDNILLNYGGCDDVNAPWQEPEFMVKLTDFDISAPAQAELWLNGGTYPYDLGLHNQAANSTALDLCPFLVTALELILSGCGYPLLFDEKNDKCPLIESLLAVMKGTPAPDLERALQTELRRQLGPGGPSVSPQLDVSQPNSTAPGPLLDFVCRWLARLWPTVGTDKGDSLNLVEVYEDIQSIYQQAGILLPLGAILQRRQEKGWVCLLRQAKNTTYDNGHHDAQNYYVTSAQGLDYRQLGFIKSPSPSAATARRTDQMTDSLHEPPLEDELYLHQNASRQAADGSPALLLSHYHQPSNNTDSSRITYEQLPVVIDNQQGFPLPSALPNMEIKGFNWHPLDEKLPGRAAALRLPPAGVGDGHLNLVLFSNFRLPPGQSQRQARSQELISGLLAELTATLTEVNLPVSCYLAQLAVGDPQSEADQWLQLLPLGWLELDPARGAAPIVNCFYVAEREYFHNSLNARDPRDWRWSCQQLWPQAPAGKTLALGFLYRQPGVFPQRRPEVYQRLLQKLPLRLLGDQAAPLWAVDYMQVFVEPDCLERDKEGRSYRRFCSYAGEVLGPWLELCVKQGNPCILSPLSASGLPASSQWKRVLRALAAGR